MAFKYGFQTVKQIYFVIAEGFKANFKYNEKSKLPNEKLILLNCNQTSSKLCLSP